MYKGQSISVVIPCYNEESGIRQTYERIPKWVNEVIVVDNFSTDKTSKIAQSLGAKVVSERNKGYGAALKKGISASDKDIVITIDGDGTYPIEDSQKAVDYLLKEKLDFVVCGRFPLADKDSMNWVNFLGNKFISFIMSFLFMHYFSDGLSGMWVFKKKIYPLLLPLSSGWNLSEEIKIEALLSPKVAFGEYRVNYHPRLGKSKMWPLRVGAENIIYLFYLRFFKKRNKK